MQTSSVGTCRAITFQSSRVTDTLDSYCRTRNRRTLYVCGTDEYGTATETQALKEGITPRQLCDKYNEMHKETYQWFDIGQVT